MKKTMLLAIFFFTIVCLIIVQPEAAFQASLQGLKVWWEIVFPGLLPFLVLFEMMLAFGLLHACSKLLEPIMQRFFHLSGEAVLVVIIGWIGGFPTGTIAVKKLLEKQVISEKQANILAQIAHMPSPLFIIIIIGSAFLQQPFNGFIILLAVWLSAIWLAFVQRFFFKQATITATNKTSNKKNVWRNAVVAMQQGQQQDGRSFGKVLGDAVTTSVQKLFVIGGFMIFAAMLSFLIEPILKWTGLPFLGKALLELHLGTYAIATTTHTYTLLLTTAIIAAACAFTGISGMMQASYSLFGTTFFFRSFVIFRLFHAIHAFFFTLLLYKPLYKLYQLLTGVAVTSWSGEQSSSGQLANSSFPTVQLWISTLLCITIIAIIISLIYRKLYNMKKTPY